VQLHISVANGFARLIVDGVPLGADEPFSGELEINGGDCLIGMFNDVVPGDGFIGRVAMVAMSREGNPDICADLHRTRTWHDITKDVRVDTAPAQAKHGTWDQSPLAFTAAPGLMMFSLDNSNLNDAGKQGGFTPGHANCLPGFKEGIPIKWDIRDDAGALHPQFRGFIESIDIETGTARGQRVELLAATWFKRAMEAWVRQLPVQVNLRSDDALRWVMDQCERPPMAVDLAVGESTFPIVFDDIDPEEFVYTVMARVTVNEGGRLYERLDGTVAYEARPTRFLKITPDAVWSQYELEALDAKRAKEQVVNLARVSYRPARVGATATTELASMSQRVEVPPNRSLPVTVELTYRDPTQPSAEVGGMDIQTPVANTDYTMNTQADGQGDDITAFAEVSMPDAVRGGSSVKVTVRNTHHVFVGYFMTRIRGRDLKRFDEQQFEVRDDASIFQNDPKPLGIAFDYQTNEDEAKAIAGQVVALRKEPFMAPRIATRRNIDPDILEDMLVREMGDMVSLSEDMSGLDGSQRTFIDGRELIAGGPDGELVATYAVTRAPAAQSFWILEEEGYSELDETTVLG
jgi:hypothetical protein